MCLGDAPDTKGGVLTLLPNDNRPVVRRGLRGMPYSKDWIAYMNAWADQKPLKPIDGPFVFKSTMEYSETGITGDVKEITRTFNSLTGNFRFFTQKRDRITQPAISMVEIFKSHFIYNSTICLEHFFEIQNISKDNELNPQKSG